MQEMVERSSDETKPKTEGRKKIALAIAGVVVAITVAVLSYQVVAIQAILNLPKYREMRREQFPPVWKDLALRRFDRGDTVEALLARHAPLRYEEAPPYTRLVYVEGGQYPGLTVIAKDGRLIAAAAGAATWQHVFFHAPMQGEGFTEAQSKFLRQWVLEAEAYKVHRAITSGQDVFLSQHVRRRMIPGSRSPEAQEMLEELEKIYGPAGSPMQLEAVIEVTKVLFGNLKPGTTLTLPQEQCEQINLKPIVVIFLYFEDARTLYYDGRAEPICLTVPKRALDWYQSLTPDQVQGLDSRCAGKLSMWRPRRED
jgi:hypothetical protein